MVAAISYLIGCVNYAVVFSKAIKHEDIRSLGQQKCRHNKYVSCVRAENGCSHIFVATLLKVLFLPLSADFLFADADVALTFAYWAGLFAVIGHIFPRFLQLVGRKGGCNKHRSCFVVQPFAFAVLRSSPVFAGVRCGQNVVMSLTLATFMIVWHWAVLSESVGVVACTFVTVMFALVFWLTEAILCE